MTFDTPQQQKKGISTHTQYWTQPVLDEHEDKSKPLSIQMPIDQVQPIPQPVRHTCAALY